MKKFTKTLMLLLLFLTSAVMADAQETETRASAFSRFLMKQSYKEGELKMPEFKMAAPTLQSRSDEGVVPGPVFNDRVWFPGEWEEVKAVVVSPRYSFLAVGHENDRHYLARQLIKNWGYIYYSENPDDLDAEPESKGMGPCKSALDVTTKDGIVFLQIMDGIQKGGAEAWVRIEEPEDEQTIRTAMQDYGLQTDKMKFFVAPGNSVWFRDCGPICFYYGEEDKLAMLDFFYMPDRASDDLLPSYLHQQFGIPNYINDVIWEGGNCLVDGVGGLVTSTATYDHNVSEKGRMVWDGKDYSTIQWTQRRPLEVDDVKEALSGMLGQRQLTVVPKLHYDGGTGHIDLYLDATDENSFYIAQMPSSYDYWSDYDIAVGNAAILLNKKTFFTRKYYDNGAIPFPSYDDGSNWDSEKEYGKFSRTYANHLICNNYILQPCFSPVDENHMPTAAWDLANIKAMQKLYPGYTFYCIDMRTFDGSGGSIHCVTKQIPADNPVRIIHKNLYGKVNPGDLDKIPFAAIITNKSGINSAKLIYRVDGGTWMQDDLTSNGNCWSGTVTLDDILGAGQPLTAEGTHVEYYIEATSNNGKTVTKPINAAHGAYYDFTLTTDADYDENMYDFSTEPQPVEDITYQLDTSWLTEDTSSSDETGVIEVKETKNINAQGTWYTIDGQALGSRPSAKGIYIYNGNKVVQ